MFKDYQDLTRIFKQFPQLYITGQDKAIIINSKSEQSAVEEDSHAILSKLTTPEILEIKY